MKKIFHYCDKCGKEMEYSEKFMIYLYSIGHFKGSYKRPVKEKVFNLCSQCTYEAVGMLEDYIKKGNRK